MHDLDAIVRNGLCVGCGLCASVAGHEQVEMRWTPEGRLRPVALAALDRATLGLINKVCPGLKVEGMERRAAGPDATFDPAFGYAQAMWRGWASDPDVRFRAATGGVLTALAIYLLESKEVDFIVHVKSPSDRPLRNVPHVSATRAEVLAGMGSRYAPVAPLLDLCAHLDRGRPFALVAKPCDVSAVRNLAKRDPRVDRLVKYLLSISCAGESDLQFTRRVMDRFALGEEELRLVRYRGHGCPGPTRFETKDGRVFEANYNDLWGDVRHWQLQFRCKVCMDPVGEQADVVAFDVWPGGSPAGEDEGYSGIAARTPKGKALVEAAARAGALTLERSMS
ncbi:MAG: Coenzyme F420 hydrogenase/dehydrogenase, beta subunit C-terminal domain, partial [Alphaproteobacteria bacterium]